MRFFFKHLCKKEKTETLESHRRNFKSLSCCPQTKNISLCPAVCIDCAETIGNVCVYVLLKPKKSVTKKVSQKYCDPRSQYFSVSCENWDSLYIRYPYLYIIPFWCVFPVQTRLNTTNFRLRFLQRVNTQSSIIEGACGRLWKGFFVGFIRSWRSHVVQYEL